MNSVPVQLLQETQFILTNMTKDKPRYEKRLAEVNSEYEFEKQELFSAINAVKYGADRVQSNGKPDDKNILMELRLDHLEKKHRKDTEDLIRELKRIIELTTFIETRIDDIGNTLRWFYIGWDNARDGKRSDRKNGIRLSKRDISEELGVERTEAARLLRQGEEDCARFLQINQLF